MHAAHVGLATLARLNQPYGLTFDSMNETLYITEIFNGAVRAVSPSGIISVIAGVLGSNSCGYLGNRATGTLSRLYRNIALAVDGDGGFVTQDTYNYVIRRYSGPTSTVETIGGRVYSPGYTGDGGPATLARLRYPQGVASDGSGGYYVADTSHGAIRWLQPTGSTFSISTFAGGFNQSLGYS